MTSSTKKDRQHKSTIDCALGERCARRSCTFQHPEGRNILVNEGRIRQQRKEDVASLQRQRQLRVELRCRDDETCRKSECPYRHSAGWNPKRNQQLYEEKHRRDEQRREEQRKHALDVSNRTMTEEDKEDDRQFNEHEIEKSPEAEDWVDVEYDYDDEFFEIQEKVWKKQSEHNSY